MPKKMHRRFAYSARQVVVVNGVIESVRIELLLCVSAEEHVPFLCRGAYALPRHEVEHGIGRDGHVVLLVGLGVPEDANMLFQIDIAPFHVNGG